MNTEIKNFVNQLTYYEQINLLMSYYMANDSSLTRVEAYNNAIIHIFDDDIMVNSLASLISMGPTNR
ncbi:hypothetical protein AB0X56_05280 [Weissella paramesenteroides]|uniref:hypothetical protein n=1 Tax=Weissella paramesenteroides TaxID=1249 RepID=UPI003F1FBB02